MGFFSKVKNILKKNKSEDVVLNKEEQETVESYDKGLEKTRKEFVSKLSLLGIKFNKVSEEYFEELEEVLINADLPKGVPL